ncbi:MAG: YceD family protein [Bacteroidota bacterium]
MRIQVGGLSEGVHEYQFTATGEGLGLGEPFKKDVTVRVTLERSGDQFHINAQILATGDFVCDRCASPFQTVVAPSYRMHYITNPTESDGYDASEVQVLSPGFMILDIAEDVRQTILLGIPLKLLCREQCAGLCPHCAKNLNEELCDCKDDVVDTRWEQLRKLRTN